MSEIDESVRRYEDWLRAQLKGEVVEKHLLRKREKMRRSAFVFLRATYWRWAETIAAVCPEAMRAAPVLAIGDTHLENFGTWRDVDGRLVWGANDFDDAAVMPWPLDLVRLAASALLAGSTSAADVCDAIWVGYRAGLDTPQPVILERGHRWLRKATLLGERGRADWWHDLAPAAKQLAKGADAPKRFVKVLRHALPAPVAPDTGPLPVFARRAGTGSLGKPRYAVCVEWLGGPVVREAKAILPSAWGVFGEGRAAPILAARIAHGGARAVDPHYRVAHDVVVRRLSPSSRKIEVDDAGALLLSKRMLTAMGREIATCHAGDGARLAAVRAEATLPDAKWLRDHAAAAAEAVARDYAAFA
jgi:hypothetical protein